MAELWTEKPELINPSVHWFSEADIDGLRQFLNEKTQGRFVLRRELENGEATGALSLAIGGSEFQLTEGVAVVHFPARHRRFSDIIRVMTREELEADYRPAPVRPETGRTEK